MKKIFLLSFILFLGCYAAADNNFPSFPMTIHGDIKVWTNNLEWWTLKVYNSSNTELSSYTISESWKYGSTNVSIPALVINSFDWSLTFKVTYNWKNYIVDSIDDSNKWEWCPSKDSITFVSADCRYDIILKEDASSTSWNNWWWWGGGWGWGWWGWGWWGWGWDSGKTQSNSWAVANSWATADTWSNNTDTPKAEENDSQNNNWSNANIDTSWYLQWDQSEVLPNWYNREFNNAYTFAYRNWITTMNDINKADMEGWLNRIAMAKMLSNYAINILGKKPANKAVPKFPDVTQQLNDDYGWAVDLAYQLGIMGIWTDKFRPYDPVTRKEFGTALSRMLFGLADWTDVYYSTHLRKLKAEWIISNDNPDLKELRGYVMTMLMRSALKK